MRISTAYRYDLLSSQVSVAEGDVYKYQQQLTTGIKIHSPSDDPGGTAQLLQMDSLKSELGQYKSNLQQANSRLGLTSDALTNMSSLLQSAYQLGLQGANSTQDSADLNTIAQQINSIETELVSIGNTQGPDGQYLFAGQKTNQAPFTVSNGTITYNGDTNNIQVQGGPTDTVTSNIPGSPLITNAYNTLETLKKDLQSGDLSAISNTDLASLQSSMSAVQLSQGTVGARVQQIQNLTSDNTRRTTDLTTQISGIQDADIAVATTNYAAAQAAYQAALQMTTQANSMSLTNYLGTSTPA